MESGLSWGADADFDYCGYDYNYMMSMMTKSIQSLSTNYNIFGCTYQIIIHHQ